MQAGRDREQRRRKVPDGGVCCSLDWEKGTAMIPNHEDANATGHRQPDPIGQPP